MSSHVIGIDVDVYSAFAVIFNILCLEVVYDSMRLFYWYLLYIYDLILYLRIMYYTVCYLTGILYAVVRQISMLFIVVSILQDTVPNRQWCRADIVRAHRLGSNTSDKSRNGFSKPQPMIVKFTSCIFSARLQGKRKY